MLIMIKKNVSVALNSKEQTPTLADVIIKPTKAAAT
jgi:hypothetical protein